MWFDNNAEEAMMKMHKIDVSDLETAFTGNS